MHSLAQTTAANIHIAYLKELCTKKLKSYLKGKECLCLQCFSNSSFCQTSKPLMLSFLYEIQNRKHWSVSLCTNILIKKVLLKNLILIHIRWGKGNSTACGYSIKQTLATPLPTLKLWWIEENESWKKPEDLNTKQTFLSIQPRDCISMSCKLLREVFV